MQWASRLGVSILSLLYCLFWCVLLENYNVPPFIIDLVCISNIYLFIQFTIIFFNQFYYYYIIDITSKLVEKYRVREYFGEMAPRKHKVEETSLTPRRVTHSLKKSSGSKFVKLPNPRNSESEEEDREKKLKWRGKVKKVIQLKVRKSKKNIQETYVAEGEIS